ncbi:MAG: ABC transporter ATP-binding protein [Clostridia bacterium]|nr:ABC transporter ATP-binding protein [Clostridia bacterium]
MELITVKDLSVSFEGRTVFQNLNFTVEDGDYLCILGENGSGKTTLMRCILDLNVRYNGEIVTDGFSRKSIGWLPQRTEIKSDFPASVQEVVLSGFAGKGILGLFYSAAQRKEAQKNMEILDLTALAKRSFAELSGGQQQRVLLCRALCAADKVLLLDEPVTGLDTAATHEMYAQIKKLHQSGMTVLMISHDVDMALTQATKVLHVADHDYFFGSAEQYSTTEYYRRVGEGIK